MNLSVVLLHPGPIPHPEAGEGSALILGLFLGVILTAAVWLTLDAFAERRAGRPRSLTLPTPETTHREPLVVGRQVRASSPAEAPVARVADQTLEPPQPVTERTAHADEPASVWRLPERSPLRLMTLALGLLMGLLVVDNVESAAALARFAGTETARMAARSIYAFTILTFVGAALAVVAPRAAAVTFGLAGLLGAFLGASGIWSDWIGGFDARLILDLWGDRLIWAGAAFLLALLAYGSVPHHRPGRRVVRWGQRTVSAPDRA